MPRLRLALRGPPDKPWEHDGCGGAGSACVCNPRATVQWVELIADNLERDEPLQ